MSVAQISIPAAPSQTVKSPTGPRAWSRRVAIDIIGFLDVAGVLAGGLVPAVIYATYGDIPVSFPAVTQAALLTGLFCYLCFRHFGLYDINRIHDLPAEPTKILAALGLAFLAVLGLGMPFVSNSEHFWMWYAVWTVASFTWVFATRLAAREALTRMTAAGLFDTRVAVYGFGRVATRLEGYLKDPAYAIRLIGVFDDRRHTCQCLARREPRGEHPCKAGDGPHGVPHPEVL
jgi:FlaA1/EpsC-like NDP-sugar epimerase